MNKRAMMRTGVVLAALLPAACAPGQPFVADTARLRPGQLGLSFNQDVGAVNQASWAFADPARTRGRPIEAARAAGSMDYIAGQLNTSPRWARISALTQMQLLQGRQEVRQVLGVRPGVPSQAVVDSLSRAGNALAEGREDLAISALSEPIYQEPGQIVLARLNNLPYLQMANVSTQRAALELFDSSTRRVY